LRARRRVIGWWRGNSGEHAHESPGLQHRPDRPRGRPSLAAGTKTFFKPQHGNLPVDFCLYWSKACGQPSADRFCRVRGFEGAVKFVKVPSGATRVQGTGQICSGGDCASFISITCYEYGL
jgi:hypothetical protein